MTLSFTAAPTLPDINAPDSFNTRASALFSWLTGTFISELEAVDGFYVQGQDVNIDGGTFYVDVTNNRNGMGTTSPASLLHLFSANAAPTLRFETTNANGTPELRIAADRTTADAVMGQITGYTRTANVNIGRIAFETGPDTSNWDDGIISFWTAGGGTLTEAMRINENGYVGVGVASLSARLNVQASADIYPFYANATNASFSKAVLWTNATRAASSAYNMLITFSGNLGDVEHKLTGDGNGYCDGSWTGGGADYAEYFEWADGNPDGEDRRGWSVVLDGDKIAPAQPGDDPFGVVSANPSVVGDGDMDRWKGKYLRDDFGAYIFEDYEVVEWTEIVSDVNEEALRNLADAGWTAQPDETFRDVQHSYAADEVPEGVTVPEYAARVVQQRRKLNPAYDPDRPYTPRADRPEWSTIGLMGKLRLRKGQPVGSRWVKMRDVSATVEEWLVR